MISADAVYVSDNNSNNNEGLLRTRARGEERAKVLFFPSSFTRRHACAHKLCNGLLSEGTICRTYEKRNVPNSHIRTEKYNERRTTWDTHVCFDNDLYAPYRRTLNNINSTAVFFSSSSSSSLCLLFFSFL